MKKFTLGLFSAMLLTLGACSTDVEDQTQTVGYSTVNLVTPLNGGESFASKGTYKFYFNLTQMKGTVSTSNLMIDNKAYTFQTDTISYGYMGGNGMLIRLQNLKGYLDGNKDMPLSEANFDITSYYYVSNISVPDYVQTPNPYPYVIGQYTAGNWHVATFQEDASYFGVTTTTYAGEGGAVQGYENKEMLYRVIIDISKKTADVIIYNAKFAEPAPSLKAILLKDLKVTWGNGAYTIEGENVVPKVAEGTSWTENPTYVFNQFTMSTENKAMTKATMEYQVAGRFMGNFSGSYVVELESE